MQVEALDRDDRNTAHAELRFRLMEQTPRIPSPQMFFIDSITGEVSLTEDGQSFEVTADTPNHFCIYIPLYSSSLTLKTK